MFFEFPNTISLVNFQKQSNGGVIKQNNKRFLVAIFNFAGTVISISFDNYGH